MKKDSVSVKSAREAALRALVRFEQDGAYLNLALPSLLNHLPAQERSLAVQLSTGTIQRLNTLDWTINLFYRKEISDLTPWVRNLLRLGVYQILYLDRIPDYAAVDETVRLARRFGHRGVAALVNALLRKVIDQRAVLPWPTRDKSPVDYLSLKYSYPQWLISRVIESVGPGSAEEWCRANNKKTAISVRPNLLRISPEALIAKFSIAGTGAVMSPRVPGMVLTGTAASPARSALFQEGLFTIQGESSALVAPLLDPRPGETVIDLCSAPGGKTTHLAELIGDQGVIYAVDINHGRLQLVEKAARRLGLRSISLLQADGRTIDALDISKPDAVLVDAPCSGLGVIRRLPEIKWRRQEKDLAALQELQVQLLSAAARLLKPGGRILYSVCSNQREETEGVVELFNSAHPEFMVDQLSPLLPLPLQEGQDQSGAVSFWPHIHELDGFFIKRWRKRV